MVQESEKIDGRKNNRGKIGNRGGTGRPATGTRPRHTVSATDEEWLLIQQFIVIVRGDMAKAKAILSNGQSL